jgi:dolichol kinase
MNLWASAGYVGLTVVAIGAVELLKRRFKISAEWTRRVMHVVIGTIAVGAYILGPVWLYAVVIGAMVMGMVAVRRWGWLSAVVDVRRKSLGDIFLPVGLLVTIPFAGGDVENYVASVLIMTYADSLAGVMSDLERKRKHTVVGSLVFFMVAMVIVWMVGGTKWWGAVAVAGVGTAVEAVSGYGSDNLTVPVAVAVVLSLF